MLEVYDKLKDILKLKKSFAVATILNKSGSGPREAGTKMIIKDDLSIIGTIGGGTFEADIIKSCKEVFKNKKSIIKKYVLNNESASNIGMTCGGCADVFIEFIDIEDKDIFKIYKDIDSLVKIRRKFILITNMNSGKKCVLTDEKEIKDKLQNKKFGVIEKNNVKYLIEPYSSSECVYIFGAGHVAHKLAKITKLIDFRTVVLDDRKEFANKERFSTADGIIVLDDFNNSLKRLNIDNESYIVIVTRGHCNDKEVLEQALKTNAKYIGMIGSRKKIKGIFDKLIEEGFTKKDLDRVYSPIGLEINAETPEEIAVSIAGEMIKIRRSNSHE